MKIDTSHFTDAQHMTAAQKRRVLGDWVRFFANGMPFERFSKRLYEHLILHCSYIAHFCRHGFFETYFADPEALQRDYFANLFGPVAGEMREYFECLEETWCTQTLKSTRSNYRWLHDPRQLAIFPPAACDKAWARLERAERTIAQYL